MKQLGIVDGDTVEVSNLHRQILHSTETVDMYKADSAIAYLKRYDALYHCHCQVYFLNI